MDHLWGAAGTAYADEVWGRSRFWGELSVSSVRVRSGVASDLEAATDSIVPVTAFGHVGTNELAQQALQRVARLRVIGRGGGERAAVTPDHIEPILLFHLR
jgi:hypothetical protein